MVKQLIFTLLLLPCLLAAFPNESVNFIDGNLPEAQTRAQLEGKPYFVHLTATWCMPCQWMDEHTFTDAALIGYVSENYLAVRMDYDSKEADLFKRQYQVKTLPSILIFNSEGKLMDRHEKSLDAPQLLKILFENQQSLSPPPASNQIVASTNYKPPARTVAYNNDDISRPALIPDAAPTHTPATPQVRNEKPATSNSYYNLKPTQPTRQPETAAPRSTAKYAIQVGVYSDYDNAFRMKSKMVDRFDQLVRVEDLAHNGKKLYRVLVGTFEEKSAAEDYLLYLKRNDVKGFVKNIDN